MKLEDIMSTNLVTVTKETAVTEAAKLMVEHNATALAVVDSENTLVGIISEGDLLYKKVRPHAPHYVNVLGASIYYGGIGEYNERFKKLIASVVDELMTTEVIVGFAHSDVEETVATMVEKRLKNLPVVDENYRLIGMVSRADIIKLIASDSGN